MKILLRGVVQCGYFGVGKDAVVDSDFVDDSVKRGIIGSSNS